MGGYSFYVYNIAYLSFDCNSFFYLSYVWHYSTILHFEWLPLLVILMIQNQVSLFGDEQIMRTYAKDIKRETRMEKAALMLKKGKINRNEV